MRTVANIMVESAYMSGLTLFFIIEYMCIVRVSKLAPLVKLLITKSSNESVNAMMNPVIIPGAMHGSSTRKKIESACSQGLEQLQGCVCSFALALAEQIV